MKLTFAALTFVKRAFALALACAAGCGGGAELPETSGAPVVLISIDTLRADRLPAYGYRGGATPALDALARESVLFEDAYAHVPLTLPAHASMFTGMLPAAHGVRDNVGFALPAGRPTLASRLKARGYRTGGSVSSYVLRRQTGIAQGFDYYDDALAIAGSAEQLASVQRDGADAVASMLGWIDRQGAAPFLAFIHLYEPHAPYAPPDRYRGLAQPYDGEVAYADELVGRVVTRLRERGLIERVVLVVTSDHGEGLGDHGEAEHGLLLYREAVHVPLLIRLPGATFGGSRVAGPVGHIDLAATLLDLAGAPPDDTLDGRSLRSSLVSGSAPDRGVYAETLYPKLHLGWSDLHALSSGRLRYIRGGDVKAVESELFDLASDPGERRNVVTGRAADAARLNAWLEASLRQAPAVAMTEAAEVTERLRALGYLAGPPPAAGAVLHPKDAVASYERFKKALAWRDSGREDEAIAELQALAAEHPSMIDAWEALGATLARLGRTEEGIAAFDKVLTLNPTKAETHAALARILALQGDRARARAHAELAARGNPAEGFELLAQLTLDEGRWQEAAGFAEQSLAADDRRVMSRFIAGLAAKQAGRCEEALTAFRMADEQRRLQRGAIVRNLHAHAADCLARLGRTAEAEREFRAELAEIPTSAEARVGLAMLYRADGRTREARAVLEELVTATPGAPPDSYWAVVRTLGVLGDVEAAGRWAARARRLFPGDARFQSR